MTSATALQFKTWILPLIHCLAVHSVLSEGRAAELILSDPIQLNESYSSSLFTEAAVKSATDCAMRCYIRDCAAISLNAVTGQCQVVVLNDASRAPGPSGTHVRRLVGADPGSQVWKAADLEEQLRSKKFNGTILLSTFNNTSTGRNATIQSAVVTGTACYRIEAAGARGGSTYAGISPVNSGGRGARMSGYFNLAAGTLLSVVVGQRGGDATQAAANAGAGGGGGTFVYTSPGNVLLLAAGGGGGGSSGGQVGIAGQNGTSGTDSLPNDSNKGFGGANGQPGFTNTANGNWHGGPGAGWLGKGNMTRLSSNHGDRGGSRADGWIGGVAGQSNPGAVGGFGGGGGGAQDSGASGGGGGFSGGGAGLTWYTAGGGGGSFCGGSGCSGTTGGNSDSDHGFVVLQLASSGCV